MSTTLYIALGYTLAILLAGWYIQKGKKKDESEYDIGGKTVHWFAITVSTFATASSAFVFVGLFGWAYSTGISVMWYGMIATMVGPVLFWAFGQRLRDYADELGALTLIEFFNKRFNDKKGYVGGIGALITFIFLFFYIGGQVRAAGVQFNTFFGWPLALGGIVAGIGVIIYTLITGFRGVVWADMLQGLTMLITMIALTIGGLFAVGGFQGLVSQLAQQDPTLASITGGKPVVSISFTLFIAAWISSGFAGMGNPQVAVRPIGMKNSEKMKISGVTAAIVYAPTYAAAVISGNVARVLLPNLQNIDTAFGELVLELYHPVIGGIMLGGLLAAIISTADSMVLSASTEFVRNIYKKVKPESTEKERLWYTRALVGILGVLAIFSGIMWEEVVFWFILFAWGGLGSAFFPLMAISLYWKKVTREGAIAGILSGFGTVFIWKIMGLDSIAYEAIPGIIISTIVIIGVSIITEPPTKIVKQLSDSQESFEN